MTLEEKWEEKNNKMRHLYLVEYHICSKSVHSTVCLKNKLPRLLSGLVSLSWCHSWSCCLKSTKKHLKEKNQNVLCSYHRPRRYERGLNHNYLDSFWLHESSTLENTMQCLGKPKKRTQLNFERAKLFCSTAMLTQLSVNVTLGICN